MSSRYGILLLARALNKGLYSFSFCKPSKQGETSVKVFMSDNRGGTLTKLLQKVNTTITFTQKVASSRIVEKLTDTSKYTGTHKERFDELGRGRGLAGRDSPAKGQGMTAGSVASQASYVTGYKHEGTYGKKK